MPIISSQIIEDSEQADGRRWVTEEHADSNGESYRVPYLTLSGANVTVNMNAMIVKINERLVERELSRYLHRIEQGKNIIGLPYTETTQTQRAIEFLKWAKQKALDHDHQALRYAHNIIDQFTEAQIDGLLGIGKGAKVKAWAEKIRAMKLAMDESEVAAEEV